ncbi:MAG: TRAP transporter small permease subunit [Chlorobiales bacterium]|nr:TRAP transporter small permease subunit [Chlorobiales bacterium]
MDKLIGFIERLSLRQGEIFSFLLVVATLQICYELTLRYAFNAPTLWGQEMTIYLCAVAYVMAGAYAHKLDAHIKVDLLYLRWSPRTRARVDICVAHLFFFFFCGVLVWQSGLWAWKSIVRGLTSGSAWDPPIWPLRVLLFLGSLTLLLQGLAKFLCDLRNAFGDGRVG